MLADVGVHLLVAPVRDRVDLDQPVALVPGDQRGRRAGRGLDAAHAGDPGVVVRQGLLQRLDLAHAAARAGVAREEVLAVRGVLLGDGQLGLGLDDAHAVDLGDRVARAEGLGEVVAGLEEQHVDAGTRRGAELHQHRVLHVRRDDEVRTEGLGGPGEDLVGQFLVPDGALARGEPLPGGQGLGAQVVTGLCRGGHAGPLTGDDAGVMTKVLRQSAHSQAPCGSSRGRRSCSPQ